MFHMDEVAHPGLLVSKQEFSCSTWTTQRETAKQLLQRT